MTVKEKLLEELGCAIYAVLGDNADKDTEEYEISASDIKDIGKKTIFYMNLE